MLKLIFGLDVLLFSGSLDVGTVQHSLTWRQQCQIVAKSADLGLTERYLRDGSDVFRVAFSNAY